MLRERFDRIQIIDLRGDSRGARPATVTIDENVFNIEVGVCVLVAYASGKKIDGTDAKVDYADAWTERAFTRSDKLELAKAASADPTRLKYRQVDGKGMDRLKPVGFIGTDWPGVDELFTFRSNGIVTYRDDFAYATTASDLQDFKETRDRKAGPALQIPFDSRAIERVSYRALDVRYLYNRREYVDFPKTDLQREWGEDNIAMFALEDGTGSGPAVWCHGLKPDQHAFRGSYGGWVFPFRHHVAEGTGYFLAPDLIHGLGAAYGVPIEPQEVFDGILALLSASTYTTRFAYDLEDDFPHVPFPADTAAFRRAAGIGARIRAIQTFTEPPAPEFRRARLVGRAAGPLDVPPPRRAFAPNAGTGRIALVSDRTLRIENVSEAVWQFSVSGYLVLYRWLRARNGQPISAALQRQILDIVGRIEELLHLYDEADAVLSEAVQASLTRMQLGLVPRKDTAENVEDKS